jgi:hypothetical protein
MRSMLRPGLAVTTLAIAALSLPAVRGPVRAADLTLFDQPAEQIGRATPPEPAAKRARYTTIDFSALPDRATPGRAPLRGATLLLPLFDDVSIRAVFERFDENAHGVTWVGHVDGDAASSVTLVYDGDGLLTGSISTVDAVYQIRPAPSEIRRSTFAAMPLHVIVEIDQAALPPEAEPVPVALTAQDHALVEVPQEDSAEFIDVLVVYTSAAAAYAGGTSGMLNLINLGISETNTSYQNSGVTQRLRLAHAAQVAYVESNSFSPMLTDLRSGAGALAGVGALRDQYAADLVTMLVRPGAPDSCGIGYLMTSVGPAFASFAFSVTDAVCLSPNYTFAHELGHNMGAHHDWFVATSTLPYSYAHGYVNAGPAGQRWRTIMAYNNLCTAQGFSCTRLLRWANPELTYGGLPTGIPARTSTSCAAGDVGNTNCDADDRRTLNNTALTVANFRQLVPPGAPGAFGKTAPSSGATNQPLALSLTWQAASSATSYQYCVDTIDDNACAGGWSSAGASTNAGIANLQAGTTYYWQVRAVNGSGTREANSGAWWNFSTPGNAVYNATLRVPFCGGAGSYCDSGGLLRGRASLGPEPNQPNTINSACSDGTSGTFHIDESIDKLRVFTNDGTMLATGKLVTAQATIWSFSPGDRLDIYAASDAAAPAWSLVATVTPPATGPQTLSASYTLPAGSTQAIRAVLRYSGAASPCGANSGYDDRDDLAFTVGQASDASILTNGTFTGGTSGWLTLGQPTPGSFVFDTTGGQFRFYRPAGSTQGVVFQNTGVAAAGGVPLVAAFDLGNTTTARKRVSVLIHDADFSDLHVCTFWLAPGAPMATFTMRTHTTEAWTNTAISFYAASIGNEGGGVTLLDNVSLALSAPTGNPAIDNRTDCGDPAVSTSGGSTSANLIQNGGFGGSLAPWASFGDLSSQLAAGVFEFFKQSGSTAGVVLQTTGQPMAAGQRLSATFQLGNSSGLRQRVTVLLHTQDFSDLHACTFWMPPGQALSDYSIRTYASIPWTNATFSVYPSTPGSAPSARWLRLDNVSLNRTTSSVVGTECAEPGAAADVPAISHR